MRLAIVLVSFALLAGAKPALAKCPFIHYAVECRLSLPSGVDYRSVKVYLFLHGWDRPSDYQPEPVDYVVPKEDGSFRAESWLNTATSSRDRCHRVETMADIFVTGGGGARASCRCRI